jgi:hypothetical protein
MIRATTLGLLMIAALAVRTHEIGQPVVRFHPTRHYRSAVLARACYYDRATGVPDWARTVADANRVMQPEGELPLMEWLACGAYLLTGHENVAIPRLIAATAWVSGAIPLWMLAARLASPLSAFLAAALYLFLPYGIVASRNFQPDPLMTMASLWAMVGVVRYHDDRTRARFGLAALLVGLAGLIKPMSVFLTVPVILATMGMGSAGLVAAGLLLPGLYYGYSMIAGSLIQDQMRMRFEPHLIATKFFWGGLARMASRVETLPLLAVAVAGAVVAPGVLARRVLLALFGGYAAFAVAFTYHMPTHDYYHLPYLAVVALGVAAVSAQLEARVTERTWDRVVFTCCGIVMIAGVVLARPRLHVPDADVYQAMYEEIGNLTAHDARTLILDTEYGYALMYHGQISGDSWPNRDDLAAEAIDGRAAVDADTRFVRDYEDWGPHYFIVTDLGSLEASPDLQAMLDRRATPVRITHRYRVYRFTR